MPLGGPELLVIVVLVLVLFGPDKLPELARGLGKGMREIRKITSEFQSQLSALADLEDERPKPATRSRPPVQRPRPAAASSDRDRSGTGERMRESESAYRRDDAQPDDRMESYGRAETHDRRDATPPPSEEKPNDQPSLF